MPDSSPAKWHLAHTTWFFETFVLAPHVPGYRVFDPAYGYLFNSYYNAIGERHPRAERGMLSRPSLDEVLAYRRHVDESLFAATIPEGTEPLLELGLNHEQQHQELILTDLKHLLSRNPLKPAYQKQWPLTPIRPRARTWIAFAGGLHEVGHDGAGFAFDNEAPRHRVWLEDFEVASHPVTHGDFLNFIEDDGYRRPQLWLSAGWDMVQARGWQAPDYWEPREGAWHTFTLHGLAPVDRNAPICHLSFVEAEAFARWAGARLPTEAEWEVTTRHAPLALREEATPGTLAQAFGDVWEWTRSDYAPYPDTAPPPGRWASTTASSCAGNTCSRRFCATPASHIRAIYRNFFPPEARWQFSGLRLAK